MTNGNYALSNEFKKSTMFKSTIDIDKEEIEKEELEKETGKKENSKKNNYEKSDKYTNSSNTLFYYLISTNYSKNLIYLQNSLLKRSSKINENPPEFI